MKKKVIGITCSEIKDLYFPKQHVPEDYICAVIQAGGLPLIIPIADDEIIDDLLDQIDGLIVTGGVDVNPIMYNDSYRFKQGESSYRRDVFDLSIIKKASSRRMPVLGICRGHQVINVAFGGTLYQDVSEVSCDVSCHSQKEEKYYPIHNIYIEKESFLYEILGETHLTNSFHHQSIKDIGQGLKVVAKTDDGVVEAIQHVSLPIYGVQFHPEMMHTKDEKMLMIFKYFVENL